MVLALVVVLVLEKARSSQRVGVIARHIQCATRYRSTPPPADQTFEDEHDDEYEDDCQELIPTGIKTCRASFLQPFRSLALPVSPVPSRRSQARQ